MPSNSNNKKNIIMNRAKFLIGILLLSSLISLSTNGEVLQKRKSIVLTRTVRHLSARSLEASVEAELVQEILYVHINKYVGEAKVSIYNNANNEVATDFLYLNGNGETMLDLSDYDSGFYKVIIEVGNICYWGEFNI